MEFPGNFNFLNPSGKFKRNPNGNSINWNSFYRIPLRNGILKKILGNSLVVREAFSKLFLYLLRIPKKDSKRIIHWNKKYFNNKQEI